MALEIVPVVEGSVTRWQHAGEPSYFLAEAPIVGANGQILLGTSSIWEMQDSTDPLFPNQMILQIRTEEGGFAYHAMDGSYAIGDFNQIAMYDTYGVLTKQVYGDYRDSEDAVTATYENGVLVSVDLPKNGEYCHLVGGVWYYADGTQPVQPDGVGEVQLSGLSSSRQRQRNCDAQFLRARRRRPSWTAHRRLPIP